MKLTVGDVAVPDLALAVLTIEPLSMSAWVVVYDPLQVTDAPGAKPAPTAPHVTLAILLSVTVIAEVSVVLPELVTTNV